jgi:hypothetical protein
MGKTIQVATDRQGDPSKTVLPREFARGIYVENSPGAQALKLMHLLINIAGGRMAEDVQHELRLADIKAVEGMRNHDRATLRALFIELRSAVICYDNKDEMAEILGGFIDEARLDYRHEASGDLLVKWWFSRTFRDLAEQSNHWAILDRQTVFALSSKYAILLFQHVASMVNMQHVQAKTFTVAELRGLLGVPAGKLDRFSNFAQRALRPAIDEINQISRLTLTATPQKVGRTVVGVEIGWTVKEQDGKASVARELSGSKVGRKVRRSGTVETVAVDQALPHFPISGGFVYSPEWQRLFDVTWSALGRVHGDRPDSGRVAEHVRRIAKAQGLRSDSPKLPVLLRNVLKNWQD